MSHFNACVLVTRNGSGPEQMADKASEVLAKFNINMEMEPYKYIHRNSDNQFYFLERISKKFAA